MAARKSAPVKSIDNVSTEDVLRSIFDTTTDGQSSLFAVVEDLGIDSGDALTLLEDVEESFLASDSKGNLWFESAYFDADDMISNYRATHAPTKPARKAAQPVKCADGKNVTVPVNFDNPDAGRRELDAAKGERVIGEDMLSTLVAGLKSVDSTPAAPVESSQNNDKGDTVTGWTNTEHPSKLTPEHDSNQYMEPTENIPAPPEGVNGNMWELAYTAPTRAARIFWFDKCRAAAKAWEDGKAEREAAAKAEAERVESERQQDAALGVPLPY